MRHLSSAARAFACRARSWRGENSERDGARLSEARRRRGAGFDVYSRRRAGDFIGDTPKLNQIRPVRAPLGAFIGGLRFREVVAAATKLFARGAAAARGSIQSTGNSPQR